ncbi:uncharacterized protein LOC113304974 [Papaver somniferum]|uniref:uncharacterized protein LOC113304974 n=1 Tax=Papaver somniferum TaxID=3469 RepID=UPI000E701340|nr:uncharacterized protein LOC113304974 [Papaver somniferum]
MELQLVALLLVLLPVKPLSLAMKFKLPPQSLERISKIQAVKWRVSYHKKKAQWNYVLDISKNNSSLWVLLGDLNFHISDTDNNVSSSIDGWVNKTVSECGLEDLGYSGKSHTWTSNNLGTCDRKYRIDMALGNSDWNISFPNSKLYHLNQVGSDHSPIMFVTDSSIPNCWKPFKFFLTWLNDDSCFNVIANAGKTEFNGSPAFQFTNKMNITRKTLSKWNREHFGNIHQQVNSLQQQLTVLQAQPHNSQADDQIQTSREEISSHLTSHFSSISSSTILEEHVYSVLPTIITAEDNIILTSIPSSDDIFSSLKSMENWSSPGPEGFQAGFYKSQWSSIGEDVCLMVKKFFETKNLSRKVNKTYISLIPKKKKSMCAADYRPIGLCNTFYKIISKILVSRMKPLMEKIISPYQATYVSGRLISDNTVIAQEIIHSMKKKRGQIGWMHLSWICQKHLTDWWNLLLKVLNYFGFSDDFCDLIHQCISTSILSILINCSPCDEFKHTRGIIQGDPLSPYLFILDMEFLSRHLVATQQDKTIQGIKVACNAPAINHLLFADECLIFTQANLTSVNNLLNNFSTQSGQVINFEKSAVYFSKHTKTEEGRSTMIKHVLNAVPTYQMGTFKLPNQLINKLTSIERHFFWGHKSNKGANPISWLKICESRDFGGLAFTYPEKLNLALLTNMAWRICTESSNLMVQLIRKKYFRNGDILHQKIEAKNCSYSWNDIAKDQLFDDNTSARIQSMFLDVTKEDKMIWMPSKDGKFSVKSTYNKLTSWDGEVNVNGRIIQFVVWKALWKSGATHRIKLFIWKCIREINQTRDKLAVYNIEQEKKCGSRGSCTETIEHFLLECKHARDVWRGVNINIDAIRNNCTSVSEWCTSWFTTDNSTNEHWMFTLMIGAWIIWKDRCDSIFQGISLNPINFVHKINYHLISHLKSHNIVHEHMHSITSHWVPPYPGIIKINVDAPFDSFTSKIGTGLIIRDETGDCIGIKGSFTHGALNPEEGECMEIHEALAWAKKKSYFKIQIEEDATLVIQSLTGTTSLIQWENRNILKDIKHLSLCFSFRSFSFISRDDNQVAGELVNQLKLQN